MTRVLFFALTGLSSPHFETELELVRRHQLAGDDVHVTTCASDLEVCEGNYPHLWLNCVMCRSRQRRGLDLAGVDHGHRHVLRPDLVPAPDIPTFEDRDALRAFEVDGVDLGEGALSSLVTWAKDPFPDLVGNAELVRRTLRTAHGLLREAERLLDELQPDLAYVFNGRFATIRPVMRACQRKGVPHRIHESAYEVNRFRILEGAPMIHDLEANKRLMRELWDGAGPEREQVGRAYFTGRRHGGEGDATGRWRFRERFDPAGTGAVERSQRRLVAVFNGSEDEHVGIGEFDNPVYADQLDGLERILHEPRLSGCDVVLRVHPNLVHRDNVQTRRLAALRPPPHVTVVPADDPLNSYDLVEQADVVVGFGTTVGVEALAMGTPSVLVGRAIWEDLGAMRPTTHDEVVDAITGPLPDVDADAVMPYGYWSRRNSETYEHLVFEAYENGLFEGRHAVQAAPRVLLGLVTAQHVPS